MIECYSTSFIVDKLRTIVIRILNHPTNGFKEREYRAILNLLAFLDDFPNGSMSYVRLGLFFEEGSYYSETAIELNNEEIILRDGGVEHTSCGSNSFERCFIQIPTKDININDELDIDTEGLDYWFEEMQSSLSEEQIVVTIENSEPYFTFKTNNEEIYKGSGNDLINI